MTTSAHQAQTAEARSSRASTQAVDQCFICEQSVFMSFFFDALGHDRIPDEAANRMSNAAKLYRAHRIKDESKGIYPFYYEGLGTDLRDAPGMKAALVEAGQATLKQAGQEAVGHVTGEVKEAGKTIAKEVALGASAKLSTHAAINTLPDKVGSKALNPKEYLGGMASGLLGTVIDVFPAIRDDRYSASLLNTGAKSRIEKALSDFDKTLKAQTLKVNVVQIAVFGADRGGSIARAFINELIEKKCKEVDGKLMVDTPRGKAELQIKFVGLFDCQAVVWQPGGVWGILGMKKALAFVVGLITGSSMRDKFKLNLPHHVEKAVHYVAANETRAIAAIDAIVPLGKAQHMLEMIWPGSQHDAIAGLAPKERGKLVDLARLPARKMLYEARAAGVPIYEPEQLFKLDEKIFQQFELESRVQVPDRNLPSSIIPLYQAWKRDAGISDNMPLDKALSAAQCFYLGFLRLQHEVSPTQTSQRAAFQARTLHQRGSSYTTAAERTLLAAWSNPIKPSNEALALYAYFMHAAHLDWRNDLAMQDMDIMTVRGMTGTEPGLLEKIHEARDSVPAEVRERRYQRMQHRLEEQDRQREAARQKDRERAGIR